MTSQNIPPNAKSFKAPDMVAALDLVKAELGQDAVILSVRQVPGGSTWQVWKKPGVEVLAIAPEQEEAPVHVGSRLDVSSSPEDILRQLGQKEIEQQDETESLMQEEEFSKLIMAAKTQIEEVPVSEKAMPAAPPALPKIDEIVIPDPPLKVTRREPEEMITSDPEPEPELAEPSRSLVMEAAEMAFDYEIVPETLKKLQYQLLDQGVDHELVKKIIRISADTLNPKALDDPKRTKNHLRQQLEAMLTIQRSDVLSRNQVVCFIGTSGVGKTTAIAKLATRYTQRNGMKVIWVCADTIRTGAITEARTFADTLGIHLELVYTPADLVNIVRDHRDADLILVDTPACNPRREADVVSLGEMLTAIPNRLTYVVAPATAKDSDLMKAISAFSLFNLKGLLLTKLDETCTYGSPFNIAWRSKLPLTYFSTGPQIFDQIHLADPNELVTALFVEGLAQ